MKKGKEIHLFLKLAMLVSCITFAFLCLFNFSVGVSLVASPLGLITLGPIDYYYPCLSDLQATFPVEC